MFRCVRLAHHLWQTLPVVWWDDFLATWQDIGEVIADRVKKTVVDGVLVRLVEPESDAFDAPLRDVGGSAADTGGTGD